MKKECASQSAPGRRNPATAGRRLVGEGGFLSLRVLIGLFTVLTGVFLMLAGFGAFSALTASKSQAQPQRKIITNSKDPLVPNGFDCSKIHELGIDKQMNFRAGAIMIACGQPQGGETSASSAASPLGALTQLIRKLFSPLAYGGADVDLINHPETYPDVAQGTTFSWGNPDNPDQVVVAYNDTRGLHANPINISGASVSTDGGLTFDRLTCPDTGGSCIQIGQSPFTNTIGDPVVLYKRNNGTWYTVWLDFACGGQGIGGYKSTTPWDPHSWTHFCVHSGPSDDRESGWVDTNPSSPHYGRTYISWNDFTTSCGGGGCLFVTYSDDGVSWTEAPSLTSGSPFIRNVQITGDLVTGDVYVAGMNEGGGGLGLRSNLIFRSTNGGSTWTNTYTGPTFNGPGRCVSGYFATMYSSPCYWSYMGAGEPAAYNHVVHYVYSARNTSTGDPGDVFYIRSTDSGVTFSAPFQLNSNTDPLKAQWEPNLSVSPSGTLFAVWYDERDGGGASTCIVGTNSPCYRMYARRSNDNGVTWLPDDTFSDVVSPLPTGGGSEYDYASALASKHLSSWVDGRVPINGTYQADAFTDRELVGTPTPTATATAAATATVTPTSTATSTPRPTPIPRPRPSPPPRP